MSKVNKFRAWDKIDKKFIYSDWKYGSVSFWDTVHNDYEKRYDTEMQWTGKVDKNGTDVYDGDLVTGYTSYEHGNDEREWTNKEPCIVEWDGGACGFYPFVLNARWRCDVCQIEVVGHIYEEKK